MRLLFDAGISGLQAQRRMELHKRDIRRVDALIISHEHQDHIKSAGIFQRKFSHPIYMTKATRKATWCKLGQLSDVRHFNSGDTLTFGNVSVYTIKTAHDAVDGVAFVVECEGKRLGILTDLGHTFDGLAGTLASLDAAYLESNYDPDMLENGGYPFQLKERIRGGAGHIGNHEAAALLKACGKDVPKWVAVAHLSQENNHPELAISAQRDAVGRDYPVHHASRSGVTDVLEV